MFAEVTVPKLIRAELRLPKMEWYIDGKNTDGSTSLKKYLNQFCF